MAGSSFGEAKTPGPMTISSTSFGVMTPAVPPNSSSRTASGFPLRRKMTSRSSSVTVSGTNSASSCFFVSRS